VKAERGQMFKDGENMDDIRKALQVYLKDPSNVM
jgi:hypothetical protein